MQIKSRFTFRFVLVDHTHCVYLGKSPEILTTIGRVLAKRTDFGKQTRRDTRTRWRRERERETSGYPANRKFKFRETHVLARARARARERAPSSSGLSPPPIPLSSYILPLFRPLLSRCGLRSTSPSKYCLAKRENSKKRPDFLRPVPGSLIREFDLNFRTRWVLSRGPRKSCPDFQVDLADVLQTIVSIRRPGIDAEIHFTFFLPSEFSLLGKRRLA